MKKVIAIFVALILCVSLTVVSAAEFFENGDLETGTAEYAGSFSEMQSVAHEGNFALETPVDGSIGLVVKNLEPGATYKLSAYAKTAGQNTFVFLAKSNNGSTLSDDLWEDKQPQNTYTKYEGTFTMGTGSADTSVEVGFFNLSGAKLYADNFVLVKDGGTENLITNGDIELGMTENIVAGSICLSAKSGEKFAKIENNCGMFCTVNALSAGTEYEFSAYIAKPTVTGKTPELLIKDIGNTETQIGVYNEDYIGGWQKLSYRFTIPQNMGNEIQLHIWNTTGSEVYADFLVLTAFEKDDKADITGKNNLFKNGNFEDKSVEMFGGEFTIAQSVGMNNSSAAKIEPNQSAIQIINGLKTETEYTVVAFVKHTDLSADSANLVIKQYGGDDIYIKAAKSEMYKKVTAKFKTEKDITSAEIAIWNTSAGVVYADEILVYSDNHPYVAPKDDELSAVYSKKKNLISNGNFENKNMSLFGGLHTREEGIGLTSSAGVRVTPGNSVIRNISGLKPNTVYKFIAYVKTTDKSGATANLVVKGFDGKEEIYKPSVADSFYRETIVTFKTGAKSTKAEVAVWNSTSADIFVDEMILCTEAASPYTGEKSNVLAYLLIMLSSATACYLVLKLKKVKLSK